MADPLVPKSSGRVVRALDTIESERIDLLYSAIKDVFDPDTCPAKLLPFLAYHRGVHVWSAAWSEQTKRAIIRDAIPNFRTRGTKKGVIEALGPLASEVLIENWYEYGGAPGTFRITIIGSAAQTSAEAQAAIQETIDCAKPYTRTFDIVLDVLADLTLIVAAGARINKPVVIYTSATSTGAAPVIPIEDLALLARYRADSGVFTASSVVTAWIDQSGNGRDLSQVPGVPGPILGAVDGYPAVISGTNTAMQSFDLGMLPQNITVVIFQKSARKQSIAVDRPYYYHLPGGRSELAVQTEAAQEPAEENAIAVIVAARDHATTALWRDSVQVAQVTAAPAKGSVVFLGGAESSIFEILIVNGALTSSERLSLQIYKSTEYGT